MRKHSCKNRSAIASCGLLIAADVFLDNNRIESKKESNNVSQDSAIFKDDARG